VTARPSERAPTSLVASELRPYWLLPRGWKPFFQHHSAIAAYSTLLIRCQPGPLARTRLIAASCVMLLIGSTPGRLSISALRLTPMC